MFPHTLYIGDFKAFGPEQKIPIRPITLIYGPNSAGKSSILHALAMLSSFSKTGVQNNSELKLVNNSIKIGHFKDYLHARSNKKEVTFGWSENLNEETVSDYELNVKKCLSEKIKIGTWSGSEIMMIENWNDEIEKEVCKIFSWELEKNGEKVFRIYYDTQKYRHIIDTNSELVKESLEIAIAKFTNYLKRLINSELEKDIKQCLEKLHEDITTGKLNKEIEKDHKSNVERIVVENDNSLRFWLHNEPDKICNFIWEKIYSPRIADCSINYKLNNTINDIIRESLLKQLYQSSIEILYTLISSCRPKVDFKQTVYFGKFRQHISVDEFFTSRQLLESNDEHHNVYAKGWVFSENGIALLNHWLRETKRNDLNYELRLVPYVGDASEGNIYSIRLYDNKRKSVVDFDSVGSGIGQILPVLLTAFESVCSCIIVEQPELHLHPALQSEIADAFSICALGYPDGDPDELPYNSFVLETHSEHILLRLMRRIRETTNGNLPKHLPKITPNDIAVLFVEPRGSHSVVRELRVNDQGELIDDWPGGFFEEGLRELLM